MRSIAWFALAIPFVLYASKPAPPESRGASIEVPATCKTAFTAAVKTMIAMKFTPSVMDRESGVAIFKNDGGDAVAGLSNGRVEKQIKAYTAAKTGFFSEYRRFHVESMNLLAAGEGDKCSLSLTGNFTGFDSSNFHRGWWVLPSNGTMETEILDKIRASLPQEKTAKTTD